MLTFEVHDDVAVLHIDDGKANVVSEAFSAAVNEGLDRALTEARAVLITGRPDRFCAGFDLKVIQAGGEPAAAMRNAGARLMARLLVHPQPVVMACTGHALAAGGLLLLTADTRIGAEGDYRIGLNETAIGLALPQYAVELTTARMPPAALTHSVIQARVHDPKGAIAAGFLDETAPPDALLATALARATKLAAMNTEAYGTIKRRMRGQVAQRMLDSIDD